MNSSFIDSVVIENVFYENHASFEIDIYFRANGQRFYLFLMKPDSVYRPRGIAHDTDECCVFCQKDQRKNSNCEVLQPYLNNLYHRLVEHPSIRLEWLYISHDERKENK